MESSDRSRPARRVLAAVLMLVACAVDSTSPPAERPPPRLFASWSTTETLVSAPSTRERVKELADAKQIEGRVIGIDGAPSETWRRFDQLRQSISTAEAVALLGHESAIVRGYMIDHVGHAMKEQASELLYPLLADETPVSTQDGCVGGRVTIADLALAAILDGASGLEPFLRLAYADHRLPARIRGRALARLAEINPDAARPLARVAAEHADPSIRPHGLTALGTIGAPDDVDLIARSGAHGAPSQREEAARALGEIESTLARDKLVPLLSDADARVRAAAARSYARQPSASNDKLRELLSRHDTMSLDAARGLSERGTLQALELLEPFLISEDTILATGELEQLVKSVGPTAIPELRRLLASQSIPVVDTAIRFPAIFGDRASVPALRRLLSVAPTSFTAADALGTLRAAEAVDDLVSVLDHENPNSRIAAAKALVQIRATRALPQLEAMATRDTTFAKKTLEQAARDLRDGKNSFR